MNYPGRVPEAEAVPGFPEVEIAETPPDRKVEAGDLARALSLERFARYLAWAGGDEAKALALYGLNTRLCEAFYIPLQALELALRNRVHVVLTEVLGERWFERGDGLLIPRQQDQVAAALAELKREGKDALPGRIVAALTFSFWTAMVSPAHEDAWRSTLHRIAVKPDGKRLARKQLTTPLNKIRLLRNRIAHHEPVLHWDLMRHHGAMVEVMGWLSPAVASWCSALDRVPAVFASQPYVLESTDGRG